MFGRKRRAQKEAAAKTEANAELRAALVDLIGIAEGETARPTGLAAGPEARGTVGLRHERWRVVRAPEGKRPLDRPLGGFLGTRHGRHPVPGGKVRRHLRTRPREADDHRHRGDQFHDPTGGVPGWEVHP